MVDPGLDRVNVRRECEALSENENCPLAFPVPACLRRQEERISEEKNQDDQRGHWNTEGYYHPVVEHSPEGKIHYHREHRQVLAHTGYQVEEPLRCWKSSIPEAGGIRPLGLEKSNRGKAA